MYDLSRLKGLTFVLLLAGFTVGCSSTPEMTDDAEQQAQAQADKQAAEARATAEAEAARLKEAQAEAARRAEAEAEAARRAKAEAARKLEEEANAKAKAEAEEMKSAQSSISDANESSTTLTSLYKGSNASNSMAGSYKVETGDNLWKISAKDSIYSDPFQWPLIYKANRDKIQDADLIFPGQEFVIERDLSRADMDAAVDHARNRGAWSLGEVEASDTSYLNQ